MEGLLLRDGGNVPGEGSEEDGGSTRTEDDTTRRSCRGLW